MKECAEVEIRRRLLLRVLVADPSAVVRTAVKRMLESDGAVQVIGTAQDGVEAVQKAIALKPDVVALDVEMDEMTGLETLRHIMRRCPRPVVMLSPPGGEAAEETLQALDEGAFDYISKDLMGDRRDEWRLRCELISKLKAAARAARHVPRSASAGTNTRWPEAQEFPQVASRVVCVGSSTGGPKALQQILPTLPPDLPAGILLVQHMPPGFTGPFAKRLDSLCAMEVREASNDEDIEPGVILVAPASWHMVACSGKRARAAVRLSKVPERVLHRPSVDVLMGSAAEVFQEACMGVILTGMGSDGAQGMKAIHEKGGMTVGQDEDSCAVYGMPRACAEKGVLRHIVPVSRMREEILQATKYEQR
jgi:two-component system chemotaxis response regulator CheB